MADTNALILEGEPCACVAGSSSAATHASFGTPIPFGPLHKPASQEDSSPANGGSGARHAADGSTPTASEGFGGDGASKTPAAGRAAWWAGCGAVSEDDAMRTPLSQAHSLAGMLPSSGSLITPSRLLHPHFELQQGGDGDGETATQPGRADSQLLHLPSSGSLLTPSGLLKPSRFVLSPRSAFPAIALQPVLQAVRFRKLWFFGFHRFAAHILHEKSKLLYLHDLLYLLYHTCVVFGACLTDAHYMLATNMLSCRHLTTLIPWCA